MMIVWILYSDGDGNGAEAKNCYVALGFRFKDL
jgi:hypothetical protein